MNEKISDLQTRLRIALEMRNKRSVDLVNDLKIPKSAISQYLSGRSQKMDSGRLYSICQYLNVSEPWLLGYDVPIHLGQEKPTGETTDEPFTNLSEEARKFLVVFEKLTPDQKEQLYRLALTIVGEAPQPL